MLSRLTDILCFFQLNRFEDSLDLSEDSPDSDSLLTVTLSLCCLVFFVLIGVAVVFTLTVVMS